MGTRRASILFAASVGCGGAEAEDAGGETEPMADADAGQGDVGGPGDDAGDAGDAASEGGGDGAPLDGDCAEFLTDDERFTPALAKHLLDVHNEKRAQYCLAPLQWDPNLAQVAQGFAELGAGTLPGHNDDRHAQYSAIIGCSSDCPQLGENISWHQPWDFWPLETMAEGWLDEEDWEPGCNHGGLHYTQMVWEGSTHVGCGGWIDGEQRAHLVCNYLGFQGGPPAFPDANCACGGAPPVVGDACE